MTGSDSMKENKEIVKQVSLELVKVVMHLRTIKEVNFGKPIHLQL